LLRAFGARVVAVTRTGQAAEDADRIAAIADLDSALAEADVVVLALPLTLSTRGLIGARELSLMKTGAILVNVARGPVIDQAALYEHLRTHQDFSAGIDTWWAEPAGDAPFRTDYPFLELPNVLGSPHNSSIITGAMISAARHAALNVRRYLRGEQVSGVRDLRYASDEGSAARSPGAPVMILPGATALHTMPSRPCSTAICLVICTRPPLETA
jgi:phosphoglycerate dehydrogenase-like enzyme